MRRRIVGAVFRRELRDVLRDRRTLFTMLVLPMLLYPTLMLGFTALTVSQARKLGAQTFEVMVTVGGRVLARGSPPAAEGTLQAELLAQKELVFVDRPDPEERVKAGKLGFFVEIPEDLEARLARREEVSLEPVYNSSDERSRAAHAKLAAAVQSWSRKRFPFVLTDRKDQATPEQKGGFRFGGLLAMMVVMMAMTGAFYPALDVVAGEKERGTLETLLLSPASRRELVAGKYLTVLAIAVAAAAANLGSMSLTFGGFASMISAQGAVAFSITPLAFAIILVGLVLLAGLFSAVCLALSTFAQTYKEGQTYMTPALVFVMFLAMVGLLPNLHLDLGMALVPVANVALLMKGLLVGNVPLLEASVALAVVAALGLAALAWAAGLFEREEVLFREGRQVFGLRPPPGVPRPVRPGAGLALLGILAALAWTWHAGAQLAGRGPLLAHVGVQAGLALIALGLTRLGMVELLAGLGLRRQPARVLGGGLVLGLGAAALSLAVGVLQAGLVGDPEESSRRLQETLKTLLESLDPALAVLVLAVLPGIAEELLFRGLVLQGLRGALGRRGALAVSSLAFALFHMSVHRFFPQLVMGLILGALVLRARSLLPAMLAHAAHNAVLVGLSVALGREGLPLPWPVAAVGGLLAVGAVLVLLPRRPGLPGPEDVP